MKKNRINNVRIKDPGKQAHIDHGSETLRQTDLQKKANQQTDTD